MYCKNDSEKENDHVTLGVNDVVKDEVIMYVPNCITMTMYPSR